MSKLADIKRYGAERCNCQNGPCVAGRRECALRTPLVLLAAEKNPEGLVRSLHKAGFILEPHEKKGFVILPTTVN